MSQRFAWICRPTFVVFAYAIVFWGLRILYWRVTHEAPFSDIGDFVRLAQQITHLFYFGVDESLATYWTPVTPSFIAMSMVLGGANFEAVFRVLVQAVAFGGSLVLAYEIVKMTGRGWLGAAWLFVLALSKPSIFWSLKLGSEAVSEALLIAALGLVLRAVRTGSLFGAGFAGAACLLLALNRPQFLLPVLVAGACWILADIAFRPRIMLRNPRRLLQAACFGLGLAIAWSPWIIRNYVNYSAFIPTGTSAYDAMLWEYGGAPIRADSYKELVLRDGTVVREFGLDYIRKRLASLPSDTERAPKLREYVTAWLVANWRDYPRLMYWRLKHIISESGASGLTTVSRTDLFVSPTPGYNNALKPVSPLNLVLLDKAPWMILLAFAGALLAAIRYGLPGVIIMCLWLAPWFTVAFALGYERAVESMISFGLWLALYLIAETAVIFSRGRAAQDLQTAESGT